MTPDAPDVSRVLLTGRLVTPDAVVPDGVVAVEGNRFVFVGRSADLPQGWQDMAPRRLDRPAYPPAWPGRRPLPRRSGRRVRR